MNLILLSPEITLSLGAFAILMIDVFLCKKVKSIHFFLHLFSLIICAAALFSIGNTLVGETLILNDMLKISFFTSYAKAFILVALTCVLLFGINFIASESRISAEFIALLFSATIGGMLMISANDFLAFYMALELQALSLYVLAAINRKSKQAAEAGVKYFILGSLASAIFLFGVSLVYGFSGTVNFSAIATLYEAKDLELLKDISVGVMVGFILIITAMFFKISAAPFHMWSPDVYQGSASIVTTFFATVVKFSVIIAFINILMNFHIPWPGIGKIFVVVAVISFIVGSLGAIFQKNLKRLLAYSSIGHIGFILLGLASFSKYGFSYAIFYAMIYAVISIGLFGFLNIILPKTGEISNHEDDAKSNEIYDISALSGLSKTNPKMSFAISALIFSSAGIPPLAGFFTKFYILSAAIASGFLYAAIIAVIFSVVSAYYYLRIVKLIYFDKPSGKIIIDDNANPKLLIMVTALLNIFLLFMMKPLIGMIFNFMT